MGKKRLRFSQKVVFLLLMLVLVMSTAAYPDYATNLVFQGYLQDSSGDIDVGNYSAPVIYDWNNDGRKDLMVGQRFNDTNGVAHGYVSFYENVGTDASPLFNSPDYMDACGTVCNYLEVIAAG